MRPLHSRKPRTTLADAQRFHRNGVAGGMCAADYLSDAERSQIGEQVAEDLLKVVQQNFPRTNNLEYAILKSHLIVEYAITQFIRCASHVLVDHGTLRFHFSQKLEIAVLQGFGGGDPTLVPSVELLNRIRNQVAHRFTIDPQLVNELIRINSDGLDAAALTDRRRIAFLRNWCSFVLGETAGQIRMMIAVTAGAWQSRMLEPVAKSPLP